MIEPHVPATCDRSPLGSTHTPCPHAEQISAASQTASPLLQDLKLKEL